jgi:hypothetical protein
MIPLKWVFLTFEIFMLASRKPPMLKKSNFQLINGMSRIYTAFHNYVPSHRPHAKRVAWIFPLSAEKNKGTAVPQSLRL